MHRMHLAHLEIDEQPVAIIIYLEAGVLSTRWVRLPTRQTLGPLTVLVRAPTAIGAHQRLPNVHQTSTKRTTACEPLPVGVGLAKGPMIGAGQPANCSPCLLNLPRWVAVVVIGPPFWQSKIH